MTDFARAEREDEQEGPGGAGGTADGDEATALPRSWRELHPPRPKPDGVDYGFLSARGEPVASTRQNLLHLARTRALPSLAWSPETPEMVPPWEVPLVLDALRDEIVARARRELRITLTGSALLVLAFWVFMPPLFALVVTGAVGVLLVLLIRSVRRRVVQAERLSAEELSRGFDALVEQQAEEALPTPATRSLALPIAAVGVVQIFTYAASIETGALHREAVAAGEVWRLLTAPMLHGGILHFWMNYAALENLGRTMETRAPRAWVPLVFLLSALAGGAASLALPPDVRSVGASGGLMGMFGFLAVMGFRRKRDLPEGFLKGLLINIAFIAVVGAVAYQFIDNAAHGGGLLAGLLIGLLAIPGDDRAPRWTGGGGLQRAGYAATGLVWLSAAVAILLSLAARFG
jgi:membrane associated rhomboid family serine protease